MTLRLQLVIEGDASGAKGALQETKQAIEGIEKSAGGAAESAKKLGDNADAAAGKVGGVGRESETAAKGIDRAGESTVVATGKMGGFSVALGRVAALVGGAIVGGAIGAGLGFIAAKTLEWVGAIGKLGGSIKDDLESHKKLIGDISGLYKQAAADAEDYGAKSATILRFQAQQNVARLESGVRGQPTFGIEAQGGVTYGEGMFRQVADARPFIETIEKFNAEVRRGTPDVIKFRNEIAEIAAALPKDSPYRASAEAILNATKVAADAQAELGRARDALSGLEGDIDAAQRALGGLPAAFQEVGASAKNPTASVKAFADELQRLGGAGPAAMRSPNMSPVPQGFATGGVVTAPTLFRFGAGQIGLMGEAGPEAILPLGPSGAVGAIGADGREFELGLARLRSGKLGVKTYAAGGVIGSVVSSLSELTRAMMSGAPATDALSSAISGLASRLTDLAINKVFDQLLSAISTQGWATTVTPNAMGNAFAAGGNVVPFARGGIVRRPTLGLVGEAGSEAVLPLRQGRDGTWGVAAQGSSAPPQVIVQIIESSDRAGQVEQKQNGRGETEIRAFVARVMAEELSDKASPAGRILASRGVSSFGIRR